MYPYKSIFVTSCLFTQYIYLQQDHQKDAMESILPSPYIPSRPLKKGRQWRLLPVANLSSSANLPAVLTLSLLELSDVPPGPWEWGFLPPEPWPSHKAPILLPPLGINNYTQSAPAHKMVRHTFVACPFCFQGHFITLVMWLHTMG